MDTILFPFTFLPVPVLRALGAGLGPLKIYQPARFLVPPELQELAETEPIDLQLPEDGEEPRLEALLAEYRQWARLHAGDGLFMTAFHPGVPFYGPDKTTQIRDRIRAGSLAAGGGKEDNAAPAGDPLFEARLFLCLAQEYDRQQAGLRSELESVGQAELRMMRQLHGGGAISSDAGGATAFEDPGTRRTDARLEAWARLYLAGDTKPAVFVTTSAAVFDHLLEMTPEAVALPSCVLPEDSETVGQLRRHLTELAGRGRDEQTPTPADEPPPGAGLRAALAEGVSPTALFSRLAGVHGDAAGGAPPRTLLLLWTP